MKTTNTIDNENGADPLGLLDCVGIQDAIALIMIYASQVDRNRGEDDMKKIEAVAEKSPVCVERPKGIFRRVYKMSHVLQSIGPETAVTMAIRELGPALREMALELSTDVLSSLDVSPDKKREILDDLAIKFSMIRQIEDVSDRGFGY